MTSTLALLPPAVAVIVALPAFTPVTLPALSTVATAVSPDFHATVLSVALPGLTVAASCSDAPFLTVALPSFTPGPEMDTDVTGTSVGQSSAGRAAVAPSHFTMPPSYAMPGSREPGNCWEPPSLKITFASLDRSSGTAYLYAFDCRQPSDAVVAVIFTPGQAALFAAVAPSPVYTYAYRSPQPEGLVA